MVARRIILEHAVDSVREPLRSWLDDLDATLDHDDLPADLVDLADALETSDAREDRDRRRRTDERDRSISEVVATG